MDLLISYSYCAPTCMYLCFTAATLLLSDSGCMYGSSPCHPSYTHCLPFTHTPPFFPTYLLPFLPTLEGRAFLLFTSLCTHVVVYMYSAPSDYMEKYHLNYTENKAHSLGVRKTVSVLSHKLSKPLMTSYLPLITFPKPMWCSFY